MGHEVLCILIIGLNLFQVLLTESFSSSVAYIKLFDLNPALSTDVYVTEATKQSGIFDLLIDGFKKEYGRLSFLILTDTSFFRLVKC